VPQLAREKGMRRLPVIWRKAVRRVFGSVSEAEFMETNGLIRASETGDGHVHSKERSAKNKTGNETG